MCVSLSSIGNPNYLNYFHYFLLLNDVLPLWNFVESAPHKTLNHSFMWNEQTRQRPHDTVNNTSEYVFSFINNEFIYLKREIINERELPSIYARSIFGMNW